MVLFLYGSSGASGPSISGILINNGENAEAVYTAVSSVHDSNGSGVTIFTKITECSIGETSEEGTILNNIGTNVATPGLVAVAGAVGAVGEGDLCRLYA